MKVLPLSERNAGRVPTAAYVKLHVHEFGFSEVIEKSVNVNGEEPDPRVYVRSAGVTVVIVKEVVAAQI